MGWSEVVLHLGCTYLHTLKCIFYVLTACKAQVFYVLTTSEMYKCL